MIVLASLNRKNALLEKEDVGDEKFYEDSRLKFYFCLRMF
jgi:hypothetical protein